MVKPKLVLMKQGEAHLLKISSRTIDVILDIDKELFLLLYNSSHTEGEEYLPNFDSFSCDLLEKQLLESPELYLVDDKDSGVALLIIDCDKNDSIVTAYLNEDEFYDLQETFENVDVVYTETLFSCTLMGLK